MRLRFVQPGDARALEPLLEQLGYPTQRREIERRIAALDEAHAVIVADDGGRLLGFVVVELDEHFVDGLTVTIGGLVVSEDARGRGIGATLLERAERWASERNASRVIVRSNVVRERAHRFYERQGYERSKSQHVLVKTIPA